MMRRNVAETAELNNNIHDVASSQYEYKRKKRKVGLYFRRRLAPHAPPHDAPRAPVRSIRWRGPAGVNLRKRPSKKYKRTRV